MSLLEGKAVVITGSGRGIGAACARSAARLGAAVVINDVDAEPTHETAEAIKAEGGKAVACVADITKWEEAGRLIATCLESFGRIDGLVNNAALYTRRSVDDMDPADVRLLVEVNVLGTFYCTGHAVKPMLAQKSGSIVNVTSGAHMGLVTQGVYSATKGAVASAIYSWALELEGTGVRVNGLSPFAISRMHSTLDPEEAAKARAASQPPEANTPVIDFLLSDLSKDINGQILRIDKGEISIYAHPALLQPPAYNTNWTAEAIAEAYRTVFKDKIVPCGPMGMEHMPVPLQTGYHQRFAKS